MIIKQYMNIYNNFKLYKQYNPFQFKTDEYYFILKHYTYTIPIIVQISLLNLKKKKEIISKYTLEFEQQESSLYLCFSTCCSRIKCICEYLLF